MAVKLDAFGHLGHQQRRLSGHTVPWLSGACRFKWKAGTGLRLLTLAFSTSHSLFFIASDFREALIPQPFTGHSLCYCQLLPTPTGGWHVRSRRLVSVIDCSKCHGKKGTTNYDMICQFQFHPIPWVLCCQRRSLSGYRVSSRMRKQDLKLQLSFASCHSAALMCSPSVCGSTWRHGIHSVSHFNFEVLIIMLYCYATQSHATRDDQAEWTMKLGRPDNLVQKIWLRLMGKCAGLRFTQFGQSLGGCCFWLFILLFALNASLL